MGAAAFLTCSCLIYRSSRSLSRDCLPLPGLGHGHPNVRYNAAVSVSFLGGTVRMFPTETA